MSEKSQQLTVEVKQAAAIQSICPTANHEADPGPNPRENRAGDKECSRSCGGQQGNIGVGRDRRVDLSRTTQTGKGVVHLSYIRLAGRIPGKGRVFNVFLLLTPGQQKHIILISRIWVHGCAQKAENFAPSPWGPRSVSTPRAPELGAVEALPDIVLVL